MEEHGYLYHEYDYKSFIETEESQYTSDQNQESLLAAIRQEVEKNPEGRAEYSELDDRPAKLEAKKKKGTARQRLNKVIKRSSAREMREDI